MPRCSQHFHPLISPPSAPHRVHRNPSPLSFLRNHPDLYLARRPLGSSVNTAWPLHGQSFLQRNFRTPRQVQLALPRRTTLTRTPLKTILYTNQLRSRSIYSHHQVRRITTKQSPMAEIVEAAKKAAGKQAVAEHFLPTMNFVGIGSGTTIVYVVDAIKAVMASVPPEKKANMLFVPTGYQSRRVIEAAGLIPLPFDSLPADIMLDVAFDGADEVDEELNCIKGGGACLFQEKLVAERARKFICVADYRKDQERLLTGWPSIPIEVAPIAVNTALRALRALGSKNPVVRDGLMAKAGPMKTDQDFFIIDAPFPQLLTMNDVNREQRRTSLAMSTESTVSLLKKAELQGITGMGGGGGGKWEVNTLSRRIKAITGVLEVGIFSGFNGTEAQEKGLKGGQKPVAVYFGMADGSVKKRTAGDAMHDIRLEDAKVDEEVRRMSLATVPED
ncbi:ribose 5-phosphate isomerase [Aulographum hederae CBS 113979]|uniref:Ribose-5-phosphate isomerase n=1 Tax=Aulographum hederae CBS 113979 TaxID=1176131 RepID=A0A6G1GWD2_9PEZI|nr:ribose 5-phosphate isomerase [Aulographum hederae CBS 113979]